MPSGETSQLELEAAQGKFQIEWFNPRTGGNLLAGTVRSVLGGGRVSLGEAPWDPAEDWLVVVRRAAE